MQTLDRAVPEIVADCLIRDLANCRISVNDTQDSVFAGVEVVQPHCPSRLTGLVPLDSHLHGPARELWLSQ
jgi:hypothetical protein